MTLLELVYVAVCVAVLFIVGLIIYRLIRGFPPRP